MKKFLLIIFLFAITLDATAFHPLKSFEFINPKLSKETCWEIVKLWTISDMNDRNARIVYENKDTGKMLISGKYRDKTDTQLDTYKDNVLVPYVSYEIEIFCSDGKITFSFKNVKYSFKIRNFNQYSLDDFTLQRYSYELEEVKDIMMVKGEEWEIDDYFTKRNSELNQLVNEAQSKMNDEKLKKKQRAIYQKQFSEYVSKSKVSHTVKQAVHKLMMQSSELYKNIKSTVE